MKKFIGLMVAAMMAVSANASAITFDTKITQMLVSRDNANVWIYVDPSIDLDVLAAAAAGGNETCHKHAQDYAKGNTGSPSNTWLEWGNYVSFRVDRFLGQEYYSLLSMAFAANKTVTITTTAATLAAGGCADQNNTLTLNYFKVKY